MGKTTDKLDEAEFFLNQIEANYFEHHAFDYFLGAFISSARSVLWIMRCEFNEVEGWESWYKTLEPSTNDEALLQKINTARIRNEKQSPLKTNFRLVFTIPKEQVTKNLRTELEGLVGKTANLTIEPVNENEYLVAPPKVACVNFVGEVENIYRFLCELGDDDVLAICRDYFTTIKSIVLDCENRFGPKPPNTLCTSTLV